MAYGVPTQIFPTSMLQQRPQVADMSEGIASLGGLIDAISKNRQQQEDAAQAQANTDRDFQLKQQLEQVKESQQRRLENRDLQNSRTEWAKERQKNLSYANTETAQGRLPGAFVDRDQEGNPVTVKPEYAPIAQQAAPAPAPDPQDAGPQDIESVIAQAAGKPDIQTRETSVSGARYNLPPLANIENLTEAELDAKTKALTPEAPPPLRKVRIAIPGQEPLEIDQGQARSDAEAQSMRKQADIDKAINAIDPNDKSKAGTLYALNQMKASEMAMFPPKEQALFARSALESDKRASIEGVATGHDQSREAIAQGKNDTALKIAEMRRKKGGTGFPLVAGSAGDIDSAFVKYANRDPLKAERMADMVDRQTERALNQMNWKKLEGTGIDRLAMAQKNMQAGGAGEFEAMQNFMGYIRGGVPAKNETVEWHHMTDTAITKMDNIGKFLGLGMIGTLWSQTDMSDQEKEMLKSKYTGLPPAQKKELLEAISSAQQGLAEFSNKATDSLGAQFDGRSPMEKSLVQGKIDMLRSYAKLPSKKYFGQSEGSSATGQPAARPSVRDLLLQ